MAYRRYLLLIASVVLALAACGGATSSDSETADLAAENADQLEGFCAANQEFRRGSVLLLQNLDALPRDQRAHYALALRVWLADLDNAVAQAPPALFAPATDQQLAHAAYFGWLASSIETGLLWGSENDLEGWRRDVTRTAAMSVQATLTRAEASAGAVARGAVAYEAAVDARCEGIMRRAIPIEDQVPASSSATLDAELSALLVALRDARTTQNFHRGKLTCGDMLSWSTDGAGAGHPDGSRVAQLSEGCLTNTLDAVWADFDELDGAISARTANEGLSALQVVGLAPSPIPAFVKPVSASDELTRALEQPTTTVAALPPTTTGDDS